MELHILPDIVIILGLSVLIILVFQRLKLPAILGFLITGIIVGPHGLNLVQATEEVNVLSEIGIIFLLFVIGVEFSLKGLSTIKNTVLIGGLIQVAGTVGLVTIVTYFMGLSLQAALFMGFLLSLSSTAIVLKMLQEKGEINSPHGRVSVAILIFQDIIVVLMMLLTPIIAGESDDIVNTLFVLAIKLFGVLVAIYLLARFIVPLLFKWVIGTKSTELFILTTVVLCFATAWLTSSIGLSLALGAFFAGLIISESAYSHQATANILPFREIFISFFFVSVGMLLDISFFLDHIGYVHLLALGVMVLKIVIVVLAVSILKYPLRTTLLTALALFQVGEFAFLLSSVGMKYELLSDEIYQYFIAISIITMGATPFVINFSPFIVRVILSTPLPKVVKTRLRTLSKRRDEINKIERESYHDHLVIIGYGVNGQNIAKAARKADIPYVIIDLEPSSLQKAKAKTDNLFYGDATNHSILKHVNIQEARVVVVAISATESTKRIIQSIRMFTETAFIIVRTKYVKDVDQIMKFGADEVIPEEFETSIEMFTRVLKKYLIPNNEIQNFISQIRTRNYETFRTIAEEITSSKNGALNIPDMEIATLQVHHGKNRIVGKSIGESRIRTDYGVTVLTIKRKEEYLKDISPDDTIKPDDILYLFGSPDDIIRFNRLLI